MYCKCKRFVVPQQVFIDHLKFYNCKVEEYVEMIYLPQTLYFIDAVAEGVKDKISAQPPWS